MSTKYLDSFFEKYNIKNLINILIILIVLFLIYRLFTPSISKEYNDIFEGFSDSTSRVTTFIGITNFYGNVLFLKDPTNKPTFSDNQFSFVLDDNYRIDGIYINFTSNVSGTYTYNNTSAPGPVSTTYNPDTIVSPLDSTKFELQYMDSLGNIRPIKVIPVNIITDSSIKTTPVTVNTTDVGNGKTINFIKSFNYSVSLSNVIDNDTQKSIVTSQIFLTIVNNTLSQPTYISNKNIENSIENLKTYGIYGGKPNELRLKSDLNKVSNLLISNEITSDKNTTPTIFGTATTYTYPIGTADNSGDKTDKMIYGIKYSCTISKLATSVNLPPPFNISISYNNTLYPSNNFNINNTYKVRSDLLNNNLTTTTTTTTTTITANIYFGLEDNIIANQFMLSLQSVKDGNGNQYNISNPTITCLYTIPSASEITAYKQNVNFLMNSSSGSDNTGVCPSINELINKQTMTQQVCDNLEYQDKVKSEKIRLERNKQYLLKLKNQQDQIDQLNMAIQDLENKRQTRSQTADQIRVLQYQKQKADVSSVIDLANQRLTSQDKNNLYMDVNLNYVQQ